MNIHEYQAKQLLAREGVAIPAGDVCEHAGEARANRRTTCSPKGTNASCVKSQIHAGGRGKGTFKSGFQGGVKVCRNPCRKFTIGPPRCSGKVLVTKQTGPEGRLVSKLLVAAAPEIKKELYLAVLLDRAISRPVDHGQHRRRHGHRGSGRQDAGKDHQGMDRSRRSGSCPTRRGRSRLRLGLRGDLIASGRQTAPGRLQRLVGMRRLAGRDQSALHCR